MAAYAHRRSGTGSRRAAGLLAVGAVVAALLPLATAGVAEAGPSGSAVAMTVPAAAVVPTAGSDPSDYTVTIAARYCGQYTDIMANRARNNIQESLRNLGKDTVYTSGDPVRPEKEDPNNPNCRPLTGFEFTLGTGYKGKSQQSEYLSLVTGAYAGTPTTLASTPELNAAGGTTGRSIAGAVTVTLTQDQASRAQQASKLWIQGGTLTDPQGTIRFGGAYGFGALRCNTDNLNGDNVEWIGYSSGAKHAFCYYYTVTPPPHAGTIVVRKQVEPGSATPSTFDFQGNISYNPGGAFDLTVRDPGTPASISFVRAAGTPWDFTERLRAGWELVSLQCAAGNSASSHVIVGGRAVVTVAAGDTVTCTYVNRQPPPPPGNLRLFKVTTGGIGSFPVAITRPDGTTRQVTARTVEPGQPVLVAQTDPDNEPQLGTYTVTETLPARTDAGYWRALTAECDGRDEKLTREPGPDGTTLVSFSDATTSTEAADCTITNDWQPLGRITIRKSAQGGTGAFGFSAVQLVGEGATGRSEALTARVSEAGTTVTAQPDAGSQDLVRLPAGQPGSTWQLQELAHVSGPLETWTLDDVACWDDDSGKRVDVAAIDSCVELTLTRTSPQVTCTFQNSRDLRGTVVMTKTITGDGARTGPAVLELQCVGREPMTLNATATGTTTSNTFVVHQPRDCTVTETADGAADGVEVTTTWRVLVNGSERAEGAGTRARFDALPGDQVRAEFTDTYAPTTGPTPQVPDPPVVLPPTITPDRPTVIVPGEVVTNAGQTARVSVRCRPRYARAGLLPTGDTTVCRVRERADGRVIVVAPRGAVVTVRLQAPATGDFGPYEQQAIYIVRR